MTTPTNLMSHACCMHMALITSTATSKYNKQISKQPSKQVHYKTCASIYTYNDICCACSELHNCYFKKAEQVRDLHFSAFIIIILLVLLENGEYYSPCEEFDPEGIKATASEFNPSQVSHSTDFMYRSRLC